MFFGTGCTNCANPSDTNDLVFDWGSFDCLYTKCSFAQGCIGGQVIVGFPAAGTSNLLDIYHWIDGKEDLPPFTATSNRELRAVTMTPLASAIDSVRAWLTDASKTSIGVGAGLLSTNAAARDPRAACRPYNIILITDGEDTCSPNSTSDPVTAAGAAYSAGINVYVVGFGTGLLVGVGQHGDGRIRPAPVRLLRVQPRRSDRQPGRHPDQRHSQTQVQLRRHLLRPGRRVSAQGTAVYGGHRPLQAAGRLRVQRHRRRRDVRDRRNLWRHGAVPGTPVAEQCGTLAGCQAPTRRRLRRRELRRHHRRGTVLRLCLQARGVQRSRRQLQRHRGRYRAGACGLDIGACKPGLTACVSDGAGGVRVGCQGGVGPTPEICDGIDNDCDGIVDQFARSCYPAGAAGCTYDDTSKAWACVGACATGMQVCSAGAWQPCVGAVTPVAEIACDGLDNNCDGHVDENNPLVSATCYPDGTVGCDRDSGKCVGQCALGHQACASNKMGLTCAGSTVPVAESCNGKDDNCDGLIDEDFPTLGQPCNEQSCQGAGKLVCNAAGTDVECTVTATGPTPEVCDGRDNDCDGQIDEAPRPGRARHARRRRGVWQRCG
jgi:hypothetical protein